MSRETSVWTTGWNDPEEDHDDEDWDDDDDMFPEEDVDENGNF